VRKTNQFKMIYIAVTVLPLFSDIPKKSLVKLRIHTIILLTCVTLGGAYDVVEHL